MAGFAVHPLEDGDPPGWASSWGHDEFGVWAGFEVWSEQVGDYVDQRMRWIVPGDFVMGSPDTEEGRWADEGPQREVRLSRGFWLAETPCTQALWTAVTGDNPSRFAGRERPVERVSFNDVQHFLEQLAERVPELNPRLPSEAEWEYACRAGFKELPVYPLPGESSPAELSDIAWYSNNSDETHAVARKHPNRWGLYDLLGNVEEWCLDLSLSYERTRGLLVDPLVADSERAARVVRGGSWGDVARHVRAASRRWLDPTFADGYVGFRLARGPEQEPEPAERV